MSGEICGQIDLPHCLMLHFLRWTVWTEEKLSKRWIWWISINFAPGNKGSWMSQTSNEDTYMCAWNWCQLGIHKMWEMVYKFWQQPWNVIEFEDSVTKFSWTIPKDEWRSVKPRNTIQGTNHSRDDWSFTNCFVLVRRIRPLLSRLFCTTPEIVHKDINPVQCECSASLYWKIFGYVWSLFWSLGIQTGKKSPSQPCRFAKRTILEERTGSDRELFKRKSQMSGFVPTGLLPLAQV